MSAPTPSEPTSSRPSDELGTWLSSRRKTARIGLAVLVAALLLVLGFFSAEFYRLVVTTPGHESAWEAGVESGWAVQFGDRTVMFSGTAEVEIKAEGYESQRRVLRASDPTRSIHVELKPLPGLVHFTISCPGQWVVRVHGKQWASVAEFSTELEPGRHKVEVSGNAIHPFETEIEVEGRGQEQDVFLAPDPYRAFAVLETEPPDATIEINGTKARPLDGRYVLPFGTSQVVVSHEGYVPRAIDVEATSENEILDIGTVSLAALPATLRLSSSPSAAAVLLDGKFVGETPAELTLEANRLHQLNLRKSGHQPVEFEVRLESGSSQERHFDFENELIEVSVTADRTVTVLVNGVAKGKTPVTVSTRALDEVGVSLDGFYAEPVSVQSAGGAKQSIAFELTSEELVAFVKAPDEVNVFGSIHLKKFGPLEYRASVLVSDAGVDLDDMTIRITRPFYFSRHEVTAADFLALKVPNQRSRLSASDLPATNVSWLEAARFCNLLSKKIGLEPVYKFAGSGRLGGFVQVANGFRLPTEAEWDGVLASVHQRDNRPMRYLWGHEKAVPQAIGNLAGRESSKNLARWLTTYVDNHPGIAPVGSYRPGPTGIHDMVGNAREWIHDFYASQLLHAGTTVTDPLGPRSGTNHVVKGGSYLSASLDDLRFRRRDLGPYRDDEIGFRIARWIE